MPAVRGPAVSVIVRARDEAASIGRCLELLRGQRGHGERAELIVVDNGSRDQTAAIARAYGALVVEIPRRRFTFGGALNLGAEHAHGEIIVALSAHAFPSDPGWLGRLVAAMEDPRVACACGERYRPDGEPLREVVLQRAADARRDPDWGYSNAAGAFRASLWRRRPFRPDLPACEDKEWALHWLERGYLCRVDPALMVEHDHTHDPVLAIYRRARREAEGLALAFGLPPYGAREVIAQWWSDLRFYRSALKARLSHRRAARLLGAYAGRRRAGRRRPAAGRHRGAGAGRGRWL
jgi:rhamnosyltransferase